MRQVSIELPPSNGHAFRVRVECECGNGGNEAHVEPRPGPHAAMSCVCGKEYGVQPSHRGFTVWENGRKA